MGLSNSLSSALLMVAMIQIFVIFGGISVEKISELSREMYGVVSIDMRLIMDRCSIVGISINPMPSGSIIYVNISNNGSMQWWDYRKIFMILDILLTSGSKQSYFASIASLPYTLYGDTINPGIVDPGEILGVWYSLQGIYVDNISKVRVIFSTQYGGVCIG